MRQALFALALAACSGSGLPQAGADLASRDQSIGDLSGASDLASRAPPDFSGVDLSSVTCLTACSGCTGVCCGESCCNRGEWCDNGVCRCGGGNSCATGQMCVSNLATETGCGFICCGAGVPCPG